MNMLLRDPSFADEELLFRWRNDPLTRQNSRSIAEVSRDEHRKWMRTAMISWERRLKVAEANSIPVATVRADVVYRSSPEIYGWELSWTVAPEQRRLGYGKEAVRLFVHEMIRAPRLLASIKPSNTASVRIAEDIGMKLIANQGELLCFELIAVASTCIPQPTH